MPLPENIVKLFENNKSAKTIATLDAEGTTYAAPFGSLAATPDGSMIILCVFTAEETPKRLEYMKEAGKKAVVVVQLKDPEKMIIEGYSIWCEVGEAVTSGPLFEKVSTKMKETTPKEVLEKFTLKTVWTLRPVKYKIKGMVPDTGKIITL